MGLSIAEQRDKMRSLRPQEPAWKSRKAPKSVPSEWTHRRRSELLVKDNAGEEQVEACLRVYGLLYTREYAMRHAGKDYILDFVVEVGDARVGIEVDGQQHGSGKWQVKDRARERAIFESGEVSVILRFSYSRAKTILPSELRAWIHWTVRSPASAAVLVA